MEASEDHSGRGNALGMCGVPGVLFAAGAGFEPHPLVDRFTANETFSDLYDEQTSELMGALYGSGAADEIIADWVTVLSASASNLVSVDDIESDAAAITEFISRRNTS